MPIQMLYRIRVQGLLDGRRFQSKIGAEKFATETFVDGQKWEIVTAGRKEKCICSIPMKQNNSQKGRPMSIQKCVIHGNVEVPVLSPANHKE